jgi:hypothetical protein
MEVLIGRDGKTTQSGLKRGPNYEPTAQMGITVRIEKGDFEAVTAITSFSREG